MRSGILRMERFGRGIHLKRLAVRFCDGCGQMFDDIQPENGETQWIEARAYLMKYGLHWDDIKRIGNTCPLCARVLHAGASHPDIGHQTRPT